MGKERILLISRAFYPDNSPRSFRATELAKEFGRTGHDVTVLIPKKKDDYSDFEREYSIKIKYFGKLRFKEIQGPFTGGFGIFLRGIKRLLILLFEYPSIELMPLVRRALKVEKDYDLLISIAVPHTIHWGVAWARTLKNRIARVWVADCGDPYMGCKTDSFKKMFYFKYFEKWFCSKADYISIPNADHLTQYYPEFHDKFKFIPQGFRFEDTPIYKGEIRNEIPTFAFAGVLLKNKRDPASLLNYFTAVQKKFKFILYTESRKLVEPFITLLGNRIEIRSYIPRTSLVYELSRMDFLVNIEFHSSVVSNSPSKLIDYAITGRPVLTLNMENLDTKLIDEFLAGNYIRKMQLNNSDRFHIKNVAKQFIELIP